MNFIWTLHIAGKHILEILCRPVHLTGLPPTPYLPPTASSPWPWHDWLPELVSSSGDLVYMSPVLSLSHPGWGAGPVSRGAAPGWCSRPAGPRHETAPPLPAGSWSAARWRLWPCSSTFGWTGRAGNFCRQSLPRRTLWRPTARCSLR